MKPEQKILNSMKKAAKEKDFDRFIQEAISLYKLYKRLE